MPGGKWCSTINVFRAFFIAVLVALVVIGIILWTETNLPSFIGIILVATPGVVVLAVGVLAINNYCLNNYSHSFEIHGLTDGLEFDDLEEGFYGVRRSRRQSYNSSNNRHSLYDQNLAVVLDSIPDDVSINDRDDCDGYNDDDFRNSTNQLNDVTVSAEINNTSTIPIQSDDYEPENSNNLETNLENDQSSNDSSNDDQNERNLKLPSYADAISTCEKG